MLIQEATLHNTSNGHFKEYHVELHEVGRNEGGRNAFEVVTRWGRIGKGLQSKVEGVASIARARTMFDERVSAKEGRGYKVTSRHVGQTPAPTAAAQTPVGGESAGSTFRPVSPPQASRTGLAAKALRDAFKKVDRAAAQPAVSQFAEGEVVVDDLN